MLRPRLQENLPISLYIHYPWCIRKCPYCDFNSYRRTSDDAEERYLKALLEDLKSQLELLGVRKLISVYFGGGTPSLAKESFVEVLIDAVAPHLREGAEISMEANPGTVTKEKLKALRTLGVNRLSIGAQSFDSSLLKSIGRIHDGNAASLAVSQAALAGFDNINVDVMHGLPGQSIRQALADLHQAISLGANHLSWYELTIEDDTYFGSHPPLLPDEEVLADIEDAGFDLLECSGFKRYEVSAFAKEHPCLHNLNYWRFNDYLGIGAGAHGKVSGQGQVLRRACPEDPLSYLKGHFGAYCAVDAKALPFEFMLNRLRIFKPVSFFEFERTTGLGIAAVKAELTKSCELGLMTVDYGKGVFELTPEGKLMLNDVLELFL